MSSNSYNAKTAIITLLVVLIVLLGVLIFLVNQVNNNQNKKTSQTNQNTTTQKTSPTNTNQKSDTSSKKTQTKSEPHLLLDTQGNYQLVNLTNGNKQTNIIPKDYQDVGRFNYNQFPEYLILQRDNNLYHYHIKTDSIKQIRNLTVKQKESGNVFPSISEKGKFLISLGSYSSNHTNAPDQVRRIVYDAENNEIERRIKNVRNLDCAKYDSKYNQIYTWCGLNAANSLPIAKEDLDGSNREEIATLSDYGLDQSNIQKISVYYHDNSFIAFNREDFSKLDVISIDNNNTKTKNFQVSSKIQNKLKNLTPNTAAFSQINNDESIFLIGGYDNIALLKSSNGKIKQVKLIKENNPTPRAIFTHKEKAYYISKKDKVIKVIDLEKLKVTNSISHKS